MVLDILVFAYIRAGILVLDILVFAYIRAGILNKQAYQWQAPWSNIVKLPGKLFSSAEFSTDQVFFPSNLIFHLSLSVDCPIGPIGLLS